MEHWWHGEQNDVGSWALKTVLGKAPASFRLTDRREQFSPILKMDIPANRRSDSGVLEFPIPSRVAAASPDIADGRDNPLIDIVRAAALEEDSRKLERTVEPSGIVSVELVSSIENGFTGANDNIPVVGPGGRAIVYRLTDGSLVSEIVVRRRESDVASHWKDIRDIVRRINEISSGADKLTISATYGYFELSKYELQLVMRPTFIFVIDGYSEAAGAPDWRQTIVEPATYSSPFSDDEGLGTWIE
jgi:hypothetical protein